MIMPHQLVNFRIFYERLKKAVTCQLTAFRGKFEKKKEQRLTTLNPDIGARKMIAFKSSKNGAHAAGDGQRY